MDTNVFLIHCGEPSVDSAREALMQADGFGVDWDIKEIEGVSPMDAAFNRMLALADRRYHVQVDADMVVKPYAIQIMRWFAQEYQSAWQYFFPLWDTLYQRPISGIKIYQSDIARKFPYQPTRHCEVDQWSRASKIGLSIDGIEPKYPRNDLRIVADHVVLDNKTAYWNCFDRALRAKWLLQKGEYNWFGWLTPYYTLFPQWYRHTGDERYLWAYSGLIAGDSASVPEDWGEKDATLLPSSLEDLICKTNTLPVDWVNHHYVPEFLLEYWNDYTK